MNGFAEVIGVGRDVKSSIFFLNKRWRLGGWEVYASRSTLWGSFQLTVWQVYSAFVLAPGRIWKEQATIISQEWLTRCSCLVSQQIERAKLKSLWIGLSNFKYAKPNGTLYVCEFAELLFFNCVERRSQSSTLKFRNETYARAKTPDLRSTRYEYACETWLY